MKTQSFTINKLSDLTGLDRRRVTKICSDLAVHNDSGRYPEYLLSDVISSLEAEQQNTGAKAGIEESKKRKAHAEAVLLKIQVAKAQEEVVSVEEYEETFIKIAGIVKGELMRLPSALAQPLSTQSNPVEIYGTLDTYVRKALTDLAGVISELQTSVDSSRNEI